MKGKIIIVTNADWVFLIHRINIAQSFQQKGYEIYVVTRNTGRKEEIESLGFNFIDVKFDRKGINPFYEVITLLRVYNIYRRIRPELVYQITIKPIIYGLFVSRFLKIPSINTICGLGYVFSDKSSSLLKLIVVELYKVAFKKSNCVTFFENKDDLKTFVSKGVLDNNNRTEVVNGAGVDLQKYFPINKQQETDSKLNIILPTRMLWDKGVREFVEASRVLEEKYYGKVFFKLYGMVDSNNLQSVPQSYLNDIKRKGYIEWLGFQKDMVCCYKDADIVVLPSYYGEGLPTVLAEACSMGLPIITTDSVGCRECVDEGVNGYKVEVKSTSALAQAIEKLILDKDLRLSMGNASREKAIKDFDQRKIVSRYLKVFNLMVEN